MPYKFNPFTTNLDYYESGGGGGASYIDGEVATYNDLPLDGTAPLNSAWLVRSSSGIWPFNKPSGIYYRTGGTAGISRDTDYTYGGTLGDVFSDSVFLLYDEASTTRTGQFNLGSITAGQNRVLTWPNANGTIARTEDFAAPPAIGNTTAAAGTFTALAANNGTLTASAPVLDLAQTWNAAAVTFTGLRFNATNTASATASLLADFQVGGTTQFNVTRTGIVRASRYDAPDSDRGISFGGTTYVDISSGLFRFFTGGGATGGVWLGQNIANPQIQIGGGSGISPVNTQFAVIITRDANDALALRRDSNPQTFNIYNTFTSATNHERGFLRWSSNVFRIGTEKGSGGGTARALEFLTDNTVRLTIGSAGGLTLADAQDIAVGTTTGTKIGTGTTQKIGFFNATPVVQQAAIADATDAATTQARLNDLLATMRTFGLIAT